ncbi:TetR family transcriptional regulator [Mycobacterium sp. 1465703.0]|uniref:TetR family transcriptional regulator n=1 Tax=Mycobacterium sp. 1465703.0 TaxID=1834078 RepID=UPI0007FCDB45|nr:TetR family transcriptional regulator [Mycobacterium sp. 1465703.0]OBJ11042.1 TetR family transcriptional regulator [Mycobacterium sp. 1465703.0]
MAAQVSTPQVVEAALRAAEKLGKDVADVPVAAIASEAGISRSTLLRRFGGSRTALNDAVRAAGVDPGGLPPVRARAVAAAASLISESGLAAATLEAVAARANCSVYSLHAVFGGRDELMRQVFERHSPVGDIEDYLARPCDDFADMVRGFYRTVATALSREPSVVPAIFAEAFARPASPAVRSIAAYGAPRMLGVLGRWFEAEIRAGHIRDLPRPLLVQQLLGPIVIHLFTRPALSNVPAWPLPDIDTVCDVFADMFVRAVATSTR